MNIKEYNELDDTLYDVPSVHTPIIIPEKDLDGDIKTYRVHLDVFTDTNECKKLDMSVIDILDDEDIINISEKKAIKIGQAFKRYESPIEIHGLSEEDKKAINNKYLEYLDYTKYIDTNSESHIEADTVLCKVLRDLGLTEIADKYDELSDSFFYS